MKDFVEDMGQTGRGCRHTVHDECTYMMNKLRINDAKINENIFVELKFREFFIMDSMKKSRANKERERKPLI